MIFTKRALKAALAAAILWPLAVIASPIYDAPSPDAAPFITGWSNSVGNFAFSGFGDDVPTIGMTSTSNSYSTASSLFSYEATNGQIESLLSDNGFMDGRATIHIDALVSGNGTPSGNLLGGILTVRAGATGIPELGAAAGDVLMAGRAIDSGASFTPSLVAFLFEMTYEVPLLSGYGQYVTFLGALNRGGTCIAPCTEITPWGLDFTNLVNYTYDTLLPTHKVAEPASLALVAVALGVMGAAARRRGKAQRDRNGQSMASTAGATGC